MTMKAMSALLACVHDRIRSGAGDVDADDAWVVHDAVLPWIVSRTNDDIDISASDGLKALNSLLTTQRRRLQGLLTVSEEFEAVLFSESQKETPVIRRFQEAVQAFGIRGLGCDHSWQLLKALGLGRASAVDVADANAAAADALKAASRSAPGLSEPGRGERQNWCYFKAAIAVTDGSGIRLVAEEGGRLLNSSVVNYREDTAGLVSVKLHHDRVDHRSWDAEFRAMARTAASARTLLLATQGVSDPKVAQEVASGYFRDGARGDVQAESPAIPTGATRQAEATVEGRLQLYMTEVPCLSCVCAMAQFRQRFPKIYLEVSWEGLPPEAYYAER
eukprot:TRINITY_DN19339_c0_g1_i1.p1 TRINITY_DN19339_c0_g1~~TRINITY_DN19339_c0_g1_i1.p1  ORF type:complete len:348 (-),score=73.26 TRINITY_DN19339_c0_g1_i1:415-1413(-)